MPYLGAYFLQRENDMSTQTINMIVYYIFFAINFIPWLFVIGGAIWWYVANKANNNQSMLAATKTVGIAFIVIYAIRFLSLTIFSSLNNQGGDLDARQFKDIFTVVQLLLLAFLPSFANTQSAIFHYQKMFTDGQKRESASNQRGSIVLGLVITIVGIAVLQFFKSIFIY